jgi:zinc transport system ATP-binding protein
MNKEKKTLLKLESVGFSKNNKWLVEGVSLEVKQGEIVTLIGPNGSGKSTTAKIALGIYKNIEGRVNKFTNKIGYVPQKISIDWTLPIRVIDFMSLIEEPTDEQINIALNLTSVEHLRNKSLGDLSGGEFQRVMIARAIAKQPDLLVLDEPVQGVDFKGEITLYELIKKISEELNCGILLISHDLHVVMAATDFVVCLNGHVCCSGTPQVVAKNNEYKELFGDRASSTLSLYEHKHDHTHSQDGTIKRKE